MSKIDDSKRAVVISDADFATIRYAMEAIEDDLHPIADALEHLDIPRRAEVVRSQGALEAAIDRWYRQTPPIDRPVAAQGEGRAGVDARHRAKRELVTAILAAL